MAERQKYWADAGDDPGKYYGRQPGALGLSFDVGHQTCPAAIMSTPGVIGLQDQAGGQSGVQLSLPGREINVCVSLTPYEFMQCYRHLEVQYVDQDAGVIRTVHADVHKYTMVGTSKESEKKEMKVVQHLVDECDNLRKKNKYHPIIPIGKQHKLSIRYAYDGKGFPFDYRVYLSYALTFKRTTPGGLQDYCDSNPRLGLDCSGYVNAYCRYVGLVPMDGKYNTRSRSRRRNFGQVRALDILIWKKDPTKTDEIGHVAIVDEVLGNNKLVVCESGDGNKDGLCRSYYTIMREPDKEGYFLIGNGQSEKRIMIVPPVR